MPHPRPGGSPLEHRARRQRVDIACIHCRQRKIKCRRSEDSGNQSCDRCAKNALHCEYLPVCEQQTKEFLESPPREGRTSDPYDPPPSMSSTWNEHPPTNAEYGLDTGHLAQYSDTFNFPYSDERQAVHISSSSNPFAHNQHQSPQAQNSDSEQPALAYHYGTAYCPPPYAPWIPQGSHATTASISEAYIKHNHYFDDPNLTNTSFPIYTDVGQVLYP
ncbi:hypothetical protein K438DRAFT_1935121 [Mycena galopus ATCC 62051]|nr:hypothetical protein K438DRAFT_1935121 [Mycena galopus ATCC 62051]